jgi:ABC-2 type transport system ATP-binding protein
MIIETFNLTKLYDGKSGCQDICLSVSEGQVFGFLGPNGAGKSTLVKTLLGMLKPTSGEARLLGQPLGDVSVRQKIGFLPEMFRFQEWLTAQQLLEFHAAMSRMDRRETQYHCARVLELVNLKGREHERIKAYSKGMQQRLGLANALLSNPDLVFLDEPTSALDPIGRVEVRDIIKTLKAQRKTVFLNSHLLSEIELTCDEVAFIKNGCMIASGPLHEFLTGRHVIALRYQGGGQAVRDQISLLSRDVKFEEGYVTAVVDSDDTVPLLAAAVVENGGRLYEIGKRSYSLEDVFIAMMGGGSDVDHSPHDLS